MDHSITGHAPLPPSDPPPAATYAYTARLCYPFIGSLGLRGQEQGLGPREAPDVTWQPPAQCQTSHL